MLTIIVYDRRLRLRETHAKGFFSHARIVEKIAGETIGGNRSHEFADIRKVLLRGEIVASLADRAMTR